MDVQSHPFNVVPAKKTNNFVSNLAGVGLILVISILITSLILVSEIVQTFEKAVLEKKNSDWIIAFASLLIAEFIILAPIGMLIRTLIDYRNTRRLEKLGIMAKCSVEEKRIVTSNSKPIYQVRYSYKPAISAIQTVSETDFYQIENDEDNFVLYLKGNLTNNRVNVVTEQIIGNSLLIKTLRLFNRGR